MKSCKGMTLVEVMIASIIFLIISTAFAAAILAALRTAYMASDYYTATCIARNRIQRAKSMDFDSIPLLAETNTLVDAQGTISVTGRYERTTLVSNAAPWTYSVKVSVAFPLRMGFSSEPVEIETLINSQMLSN